MHSNRFGCVMGVVHGLRPSVVMEHNLGEYAAVNPTAVLADTNTIFHQGFYEEGGGKN